MKNFIAFLSLLYYIAASGQIVPTKTTKSFCITIANTQSTFGKNNLIIKDSIGSKNIQVLVSVAYSQVRGNSIGVFNLNKYNLSRDDTLSSESSGFSFGFNYSINRLNFDFGLEFTRINLNFIQNTSEYYQGSHNSSTAGYSGYNLFTNYFDSKFNWINTKFSIGSYLFKYESRFNILPLVTILPGFFVKEITTNSWAKKHSHYESYGPLPPYSTVNDKDSEYIIDIFRINKFGINYRCGLRFDFRFKERLKINLEVGTGLFRTSYLSQGSIRYYSNIKLHGMASLTYKIK